MRLSDEVRGLSNKFEVFVCIVLFFSMLLSCGFYLNIKLNGKTSNLPPLSENDKNMLLKFAVSESIDADDDLLEPTFVGVKTGDLMIAVQPLDEYRRSVEGMVYETVRLLFGGTAKSVVFSSADELEDYMLGIKTQDNYVLISFYNDLPSAAVLPCVQDDYGAEDVLPSFLFRHLFLLPDDDGNLYACAVSSDNSVNELYPSEDIRFDKIISESYDVSEGWVEFAFSDNGLLMPEFTTSIEVRNYRIEPYADLYGKGVDSKWVNDLFDVFSINSSLVKSFALGENQEEISYIAESKELIVNDDGSVTFRADSTEGVALNEYIAHISDSSSGMSFQDKIYALKKIIGGLIYYNDVSYSMVGLDYDSAVNSLKVYFKYVTDGIFLYDTPYDAVFEINDNMLVYADFRAVQCSATDETYDLIPQRYASAADKDGNSVVLVMSDLPDGNALSVGWGKSSYGEVGE